MKLFVTPQETEKYLRAMDDWLESQGMWRKLIPAEDSLYRAVAEQVSRRCIFSSYLMSCLFERECFNFAIGDHAMRKGHVFVCF